MNCFNLLPEKKKIVQIILKQFPSQLKICCNVAPTYNSVKNSVENRQCASTCLISKFKILQDQLKTKQRGKVCTNLPNCTFMLQATQQNNTYKTKIPKLRWNIQH